MRLEPHPAVQWSSWLLFVVLATAFFVVGVQGAKSSFGESDQVAAERFLTLPFADNPDMRVQAGWHSCPGCGIDYIRGELQPTTAWQSFEILAAAEGNACGNCTSRAGNAVWIVHSINGKTYYTYYGHLDEIAAGIPRGDLGQTGTKKVKRGESIGTAGDSGGAPRLIHLHFMLKDASDIARDPYGIYTTREFYFPGGTSYGQKNPDHPPFWTTDPPSYPQAQAPTETPSATHFPANTETASPTATATATPTPSPTSTPTPTQTPEPVSTLIRADIGGFLRSNDELQSTLFQIRPGAFITDSSITYAHRADTNTGLLSGVGHGFELSAVDLAGTPVVVLSDTIEVAISYRKAELGPAIGGTLSLYRFESPNWVTQGITSTLQATDRILIAIIDRMGRYAALGQTNRTNIPIVIRSQSAGW